jgi:hypothetical protein
MDPTMKRIISISLFLMVLAVISPIMLAEETQTIIDPTGDVIYTDAADITGETQDEIQYTDERPNVDIVKMTYSHADNSKEVTIVIEVDGIIENRNDLDIDNIDPESTNFSGSVVTYFVELETSYSAYQIEYVNENCTVNQEEASYTVSGSELSITFNLEQSNETFKSIIGYTTEIEVVSLLDMKLYMDIAPNDSLFVASISAPFTGNTGKSISFTGEYEDFLELSTGPYTYTWDWDDGTTDGSGKTTSHKYQLPGKYTVTLTISDSTDYSAEATQTITISNENGNNGGNGNEPDNGGSGVTLFILVVVIVVIIGIIALVVVIRR